MFEQSKQLEEPESRLYADADAGAGAADCALLAVAAHLDLSWQKAVEALRSDHERISLSIGVIGMEWKDGRLCLWRRQNGGASVQGPAVYNFLYEEN